MQLSFGSTRGAGPEPIAVHVPSGWHAGSTPVVYLHQLGGGASTGSSPATAPGFYELIRGIALDWMVVVPDLGGPGEWASNLAVTRCEQALDYARTSWAAGPRVHFLTSSMNTPVAFRYNLAHPGEVRSVVSVLGAFDYEDVRANQRPTPASNFRAAIDAKHGVAYPAPLPAGVNPASNPAAHAGLPVLAYAANDDTTVPFAVTKAFIDALGAPARLHSIGNLAHTDTAVGAVDTREAREWFAKYNA